jgi:outer membrane protein TolC
MIAGVMLLVLLPCAAAAQAPRELSLSLRKALDIALAPDGNTRIRLASEAMQQAEQRRLQARATLLPNVDASVGGQNLTRNLRALGIPSPIPGVTVFPEIVGPFFVFDARAAMTQSVFDFSVITRYKAAKERQALAKVEDEVARNQVADQVSKAYLHAVRADAAVEAGNAAVKLAESLARLANSQKAAGTGTGIEITRAGVQLANERQKLIEARLERERTGQLLLRTLNLDLAAKVELTDRLSFTPSDPLTVEAALETAREFRAELNAQKKREQISRLYYDSVKYERLPSINGYADYGTIGLTIPEARMTRTFALTLKVPLWDGGRRDARSREALSQYRQEQINTQDLAKQVELEIRLALHGLQAATELAKVAGEGLKLAENEMAQAARRYEAGVVNGIEVTDAQTRLERARDSHVGALYAYNLARINLATAMGAIHRIIQ